MKDKKELHRDMTKKTRLWTIFVLLLFMLLFSACSSSVKEDKYAHLKDSLKTQCEKYAVELQSDSLRMTAEEYLKFTKPNSRDYFKACHFGILADFNSHNYTSVLSAINKITADSALKDYPDIACRYQFTRGRALQYSQKADEAIAAFKTCMTYDTTEDTMRQNISTTVINAMLQLMNTAIASGKHAKCEAYFKSLIAHPTPIVRDYCLRDLYSISAYAFYMNDDMKRASAAMDHALAIHYLKPDPQSLFRDYSYASAIFSQFPKRKLQTFNLCREALKIGYANSNVAGMEWLTVWFGTLCKESGNITDAIDLYRESITISQKKGNLKGEIDACNRLNQLYLQLNQNEEANKFANFALDKIRELKDDDPAFMGQTYLRKAVTMFQMNRMDSALLYSKFTDIYFVKLPYGNGNILLDQVKGALYLTSNSIKDKNKGIGFLKQALAAEEKSDDRADIFLQLAKGYIALHRISEGEAMLDSMNSILKSFSTPTYLHNAYKFGLIHYLKTNNTAMIRFYATEYLKESSSLFNDEVAKKLSQFSIKYETEKKEQQLRITQYELKNKELNLQLYIGLTAILLVTLISCLLFIIYKRRIFQLHQQLTDQKLNELSEKLDTIGKQRENAERKLNDLMTNMRNNHTIEAVTPEIYRSDGEGRFRTRFNQLYPSFLSNLKEIVPNITKREEIFCMLIALNQTTEQIADTLCIEKKSINMLRYRIRIKIQIQRNDSLEDFIKNLIK